MFRTIAVALVLMVATLSSASAEQTERQRLAQEVMRLMEMETTLSDLFTSMAPIIASGAAGDMGLTAAQTTRFGEIVAEEFRAETPGLVAQLGEVYAQRLDETQLRDIVAFLRSPGGVAFMRVQAEAQAELDGIGEEGGMRAGVRAVTRFMQENAAPPPQL